MHYFLCGKSQIPKHNMPNPTTYYSYSVDYQREFSHGCVMIAIYFNSSLIRVS